MGCRQKERCPAEGKPSVRRRRARWPNAVIVIVVIVQPVILTALGLSTTEITALVAAYAVVLKVTIPLFVVNED
jgi:Flp pilus assembly protein protease CpaA